MTNAFLEIKYRKGSSHLCYFDNQHLLPFWQLLLEVICHIYLILSGGVMVFY